MDIWEIYDQHYSRVRKFILAVVKNEWAADDLIQETFLRVQEKLDELKDPLKITSWIFRIAHNLCLDYFRQPKPESMDSDDLLKTLDRAAPEDVAARMEQSEMSECVQNQMNLLPESLRVVLVLYDQMEFSHREIAEVLETTIPNVKVRLHRARKKLKSILEEKCAFEKDERNVLVCTPVTPFPKAKSIVENSSKLKAESSK